MKFAHTRLALMALPLAMGLAFGLGACTASTSAPAPSPVTTQSLQAAQWTAVAIDGVAVVKNPKPTLRWTSTQQIVGSAGCNLFRGRAVIDADSFRIGPIGGVGPACITAPSGQEDMFFKAIENTRNARLEDGQLVLLDAAGKVLARLDPSRLQ